MCSIMSIIYKQCIQLQFMPIQIKQLILLAYTLILKLTHVIIKVEMEQ
ncbi:unnamed protein product [Paramecium pentaurelia]|uniref:Uncharacterized protein n=1 Tax=Paramecium pentaurelia TaxID=43138 RepID=A0A8S1YHF1_9CILI|nr:unnamed protein product [Paramecium pentaurelia]